MFIFLLAFWRLYSHLVAIRIGSQSIYTGLIQCYIARLLFTGESRQTCIQVQTHMYRTVYGSRHTCIEHIRSRSNQSFGQVLILNWKKEYAATGREPRALNHQASAGLTELLGYGWNIGIFCLLNTNKLSRPSNKLLKAAGTRTLLQIGCGALALFSPKVCWARAFASPSSGSKSKASSILPPLLR